MTLAERIKDARTAKHYTQKDLAELMNVRSTTISGWELGRNEPSIETLKKLANKLDVSFSYLTGVERSSDDIATDDLDKMLDQARSFDGVPITGNDKEIVRTFLKGRFSGR